MLKLLIADDEPKIRRGLFKALDWGQMGIEAAGFAENGQQALDLVSEQPFDIGLIDICMPIVNGLLFIEKLKTMCPGMVCIVISGHDEFEFMQQSIRLNVFDYLLKPVKVPALEVAVRRAVECIESRRRLALQEESTRKLLEKNIVPLREAFLREMVSGVLSPEEIEERAAILNLDAFGRFGLLMASFAGSEMPQGASGESARQMRELLAHNLAGDIMGEESIRVFDGFGNLIVLTLGSDEASMLLGLNKWDRLTPVKFGLKADATTRVFEALHSLQGLYAEWIEAKCARSVSPLVQALMCTIEERYTDPDFGLEELARSCHVSGGHLSRLFRQETGMTFIDYLIRVRIRKAAFLLSSTGLMVYEVANRVGYNSQHYFCAEFKRVTGLAPTEYRENGVRKDGAS